MVNPMRGAVRVKTGKYLKPVDFRFNGSLKKIHNINGNTTMILKDVEKS